MNRSGLASIGAALCTSILLNACSTPGPRPASSGASTSTIPATLPKDPTPRPEPRSRYGNGPVYEVFGQRYEVMDSSHDYREQGVASWYGKKFHGRPTASREPYDMYAMTAAHKSLPLPTYVEVRNLRNNKRVIVRVNDRGPFVDNRVIDLSYAAAHKLDMVRDGTSLVEITAISFDAPVRAAAESATAAEPTQDDGPAQSAAQIFVQVGAFGDRGNAARRHRLLREHGIAQAFVHEEQRGSGSLYRVRIGPISGVDQYDEVVGRLNQIGIADTHLVAD